MQKQKPFGGMQAFIILWVGQLVSLVGTAITRFALLVWAYQQTGDATTIALLGFFSFAPYVLVSPFAGVVVDRFDRRRVLILTDLGAGVSTILILALYATGSLQIWHLYLLEALSGFFEAFQLPAQSAALTVLVPMEHRARANGLRSLANWASQVLAPVLAGLLLPRITVGGVMLIDVVTFGAAVLTLLLVRIPRPPLSEEGQAARGDWRGELAFGFRYIFARKGLLGLLGIFIGLNLFGSLTYMAILPAMILARSGGSEGTLAIVQGALGLGGVLGGVAVSVWGLPKRRVHGVLMGAALSFLFGDFLFAVGQSVTVWAVAAFVAAFFIPYIFSGDGAIWQAKVPPDVQGKVFAAQNMLRTWTIPVGYLIAGPLADHVFEPGMAPGGSLASVFGRLVGAGEGAGMALMFVCTCIGGTLISLSGYLIPAVRRVESDLPDYHANPSAVGVAVAGD